jgi:light-regulated signal transduction histidine kinase (bacteriophytochrome)
MPRSVRDRTPPPLERPPSVAPGSAEEELQAFSYIVSHDLAMSFRHVAEFSRLLMVELGDGLTERQQTYAEHVAAASARCQMMIEQLLAFSRVQQRALEPSLQDATLAMRLALLRLAVKVQLADAEAEIEPLGEVIADHDLLGLAFHHLMDNAIKFRRPDVRPHVKVSAVRDGRMWRLRVADNGLGVDRAHREKAFQMFHRLQGEAFPGVGAGLAICRRIARRHGGEARFVDSGSGACLELALPLAGPPAHE